ncbi:hypothetical protein V8G61_03080 [Gaetbulibacter sp. M240]|uniref:hypothetical protein n=1 Tax=Gaetbulibacter sp. M240 TaxID=3126511 RepID=UPI00374F7B79
MKVLKYIGLVLCAYSCSSLEFNDFWKNPDIDTYSPNKVLVVGMTSNQVAREQFENQLKEAYEFRGIEAVTSLELLGTSYTSEMKTEADLKALEDSLIADGFDTILLTKVIGVEDKIAYKTNYEGFEPGYTKFKEDYLKYQDAYYNPDYYEEYAIFHTETSLYCICPKNPRELIWKGSIDVTDPESIEETVSEYVQLVIIILDEEQLTNPGFINTGTGNPVIQ